MEGKPSVAPLWLVPNSPTTLPILRTARPTLAVIVSATAALALVPAYILISPPSIWTPESLFAILLSLGFVSVVTAIRVRTDTTLDAGSAVALVGVVLLGPLPGF